MFKMIARMSLFSRLREQMHPGYAYLITTACYPKLRPPRVVRPIVDPVTAYEHLERWQQDADADPIDLIHRIFGEEQDEAIEGVLRRGEELSE